MNFRKTFALGFFLLLGLSAHSAPAQANVTPTPRLSVPAVRCDLRTDNALPAMAKRARPSSHATQTKAPSHTFEHAPDTWRDLHNLRSPNSVSDAADSLPPSSDYLFRSGLSPPL